MASLRESGPTRVRSAHLRSPSACAQTSEKTPGTFCVFNPVPFSASHVRLLTIPLLFPISPQA